jgi:oligogalacturonide lyase
MNAGIVFVSCLILQAACAFARLPDGTSVVGRILPSEKKTWVDDTTGYEITQWTTEGTSNHPYFTTESFVDDNSALIFSRRAGKKQLYKLNLLNGEMTQMTDADNLGNIEHLPQFKTVWYLDGDKLHSLNTTTFQATDVYGFEDFQSHVGSFSVTCDGRWFVFAIDRSDGKSGTCEYGPFAIYKLNLQDKSITKITPDLGFNISHVQANPTDPKLVLFCWQWDAPGRPRLVGASPIRMWWVNIDGSDGGPFAQPFGLHRTHEAWTPDGKFVTYSGDFRFGPQKGREVLGIQSLDGTTDALYDATVWHAHQNMFKDNKHWVADLHNHDDRLLTLFERGEGTKLKSTVLFRHASSWDGQSSHPHPRFSPNGRYILFSTDRTGQAQVYTVAVNLDAGNKSK